MDPHKVCRICGDEAKHNKHFHIHYGAVCCTGCKAFFRRIQQDGKVIEMLNCIGYENKCDIKPIKRLKCKRCRLVKCFEIGMKPELVLSDEERLKKYHKKKKAPQSSLSSYSNEEMGSSPNYDRGTETTSSRGSGIDMKSAMDSLLQAHKMAESEHMLTEHLTTLVISSHLNGWPSLEFTKCICEMIPANLHRMLSKFVDNNPYLRSLTANDQNLLLSHNSALFSSYIMARYFGADNGLDQLTWIVGPLLSKLTMAEIQSLVRISFEQFNANGHLIPLHESEMIAGFTQSFTMIHDNFKYPQLYNGSIAFLILSSTSHWPPELQMILDEPQRIRHMANFAKDIISFARLDSDKQDQLISTLVTMTTILKTRRSSLSRPLASSSNDYQWLEGKLEVFDNASRLPLPNELLDLIVDYSNGNTSLKPKIALCSTNILARKFQYMIDGLIPDFKLEQKVKLLKNNLHNAICILMVQALHLPDFTQQMAAVGSTSKLALAEPLSFEKLNGKLIPTMKKHEKFRCVQLRKVLDKFTRSRKLVALLTYLVILDDPDSATLTGLRKILASFLFQTIEEMPEFKHISSPKVAVEDFFKCMQEYTACRSPSFFYTLPKGSNAKRVCSSGQSHCSSLN